MDERVEAILDLVLRPARKVLADLRPLAADLAVQFQDSMVLLLAPLLLLYAGVQLVDEPLSDLLAIFRAQHLGEELPVLSIFFDQLPDCLIFFRGPYLVVFAQLREPAVPVEALVLVSVVHECGDFSPLLGELLVELEQLVVFFIGPRFHFPFGDLLVLLPHLHVDGPPVLGEEGNDKLRLHFFYNQLNINIQLENFAI